MDLFSTATNSTHLPHMYSDKPVNVCDSQKTYCERLCFSYEPSVCSVCVSACVVRMCCSCGCACVYVMDLSYKLLFNY